MIIIIMIIYLTNNAIIIIITVMRMIILILITLLCGGPEEARDTILADLNLDLDKAVAGSPVSHSYPLLLCSFLLLISYLILFILISYLCAHVTWVVPRMLRVNQWFRVNQDVASSLIY